ncbi:MAG: cysteine desulfurase [Clostridia bacterium]|nr:cysteine desulfurase [Clostridia bacterium]MBR3196218.1 cysteine desulfurase [Clostridia bacterium]
MIYMDNSATTMPRREVTQAVARAMEETWFNPSSAYAPALNSEKALERARHTILTRLGASSAGTVVFTGGGTEGDNLAVIGACNALRRRMHHLVTTAVEHPAVRNAAAYLADSGWDCTVLPTDPFGRVFPDQVAAAVREDTALVSVMHVNNETGCVNDVAAIAEAVKKVNPVTLVHVDAVQAFLRIPIDLSRTKIDLYSASGHKIHGPKGTGFLFVRRGVRLEGVQVGGGQEMGLRSGTQNVPDIIGLECAVRCWDDAEPGRIRAIRDALQARIAQEIPDIRVNSPSDGTAAPHILNIGFAGVRAETLLHALEQKQIYVSTGSACSSKHRHVSEVLDAAGVPEPYLSGSIRFSFGAFNTQEEISATVDALKEQVTLLRRFRAR